MAVAAGLARHVLVYRTVTEGTAQGDKGRAAVTMGADLGRGGRPMRLGGFMQWMLPYGAFSAANWLAMYAMRHFHEFGTTREQLGQIAVNGRRNAALNDLAVYRDPLTLENYLAARVVHHALRALRLRRPCDGSTAVIISHVDTAGDAPHPVVRFEAMGTALRGRPSWDQWDDITTFACRDAAAQMWSRTDVKPADVQTAQLYDGFSFLALAWIERWASAARAKAALPRRRHADRARRAAPAEHRRRQLSAGRLHGFGHMHEAVLQLMGRAGARQVTGGRG